MNTLLATRLAILLIRCPLTLTGSSSERFFRVIFVGLGAEQPKSLRIVCGSYVSVFNSTFYTILSKIKSMINQKDFTDHLLELNP